MVDDLRLHLARAVARSVAPADEPMLRHLWPAYERRPDRYARDPRQLVGVGGGRVGGAGVGETLASIVPFLLPLVAVALDAVAQAARDEVVSGLSARMRARFRRPKPKARAVRLTAAQILAIEASVDACGRRWGLSPDEIATLRFAVRDAFVARFGEDGGPPPVSSR